MGGVNCTVGGQKYWITLLIWVLSIKHAQIGQQVKEFHKNEHVFLTKHAFKIVVACSNLYATLLIIIYTVLIIQILILVFFFRGVILPHFFSNFYPGLMIQWDQMQTHSW